MPRETEVEFGWLPERTTYEFCGGAVTPLQDLDERVALVRDLDRISGGWFYPPLERRHRSLTAKGPPPELYARTFSLPTTHRLTLSGAPSTHDQMIPLFVLMIGFLKGLRLLPEGWLHWMRAAVRPGILSDFECDTHTICEVLELTLDFWHRNQDREIRNGLFGALHWYLLGQSYENRFETFTAQYIVLDACWSVYSKIHPGRQRLKHAERVVKMATTYCLDLPDWAKTDADGKSELSELRNELFHEAKWAGRPIGFSRPESDAIDYELGLLNARLLLALLGWKNPFIRSRVQMGAGHNVRATEST